MIDLIRRTVPLSRGATERRRNLREQETSLRGQLGRDPTTPELAAAMGMDVNQLAVMRGSSEPLRFEPIDEVYSDSNIAFADTRPGSLELLVSEETRESLAAAIAALPERLQLVVQLYFMEELNLSEIAEALQVSVPRVHQIKAQALGKLREAMAGIVEII